MISVRTATGLKDMASLKVRTALGLKPVDTVSVRTAVGLKVVWSGAVPLVATVPPSAFGAGASDSAIAITSEVVSVSVTGGKAPYTYAWSKSGAPDSNWLILAANSPSSRFQHIAVPSLDSRIASFICTVTDANGTVDASGLCEITLENFGGLS